MLVAGGGGGGSGAMARLSLVLSADPPAVFAAATAWRAMADRLGAVEQRLTARLVPQMQEAWGGRSSELAQAAFTRLASQVSERAQSMRRVADELDMTARAAQQARAEYERIQRQLPEQPDPVPPSGQNYSLAAESAHQTALAEQSYRYQLREQQAQAAYDDMARQFQDSGMRIREEVYGARFGHRSGGEPGSSSDAPVTPAVGGAGVGIAGVGAASSGLGLMARGGPGAGRLSAYAGPGGEPLIPAASADGGLGAGLVPSGVSGAGSVDGDVPGRVDEDPVGAMGGAGLGLAGGAAGAVGGALGGVRRGTAGAKRDLSGMYGIGAVSGPTPASWRGASTLGAGAVGGSRGAGPGSSGGSAMPGRPTAEGPGSSTVRGAGPARSPGVPGVVAGSPGVVGGAGGSSEGPSVRRYGAPRVTGLPSEPAGGAGGGRAPMNPMPGGRGHTGAVVGGVVHPGGSSATTSPGVPGAAGAGAGGGMDGSVMGRGRGRTHDGVSGNPWLDEDEEAQVAPPVLGKPNYLHGGGE